MWITQEDIYAWHPAGDQQMLVPCSLPTHRESQVTPVALTIHYSGCCNQWEVLGELVNRGTRSVLQKRRQMKASDRMSSSWSGGCHSQGEQDVQKQGCRNTLSSLLSATRWGSIWPWGQYRDNTISFFCDKWLTFLLFYHTGERAFSLHQKYEITHFALV